MKIDIKINCFVYTVMDSEVKKEYNNAKPVSFRNYGVTIKKIIKLSKSKRLKQNHRERLLPSTFSF